MTRALFLALLLAGCTRHKAEAPPPKPTAPAEVKEEPVDTTDCFGPASVSEYRLAADALETKKAFVNDGKRYACVAAERVAERDCYRPGTLAEADRLNAYLKDHAGAFEVAGKIFRCVDGGAAPATDCYVAKTKAEFERLLPRSIEGGLEVNGTRYPCLQNGAAK